MVGVAGLSEGRNTEARIGLMLGIALACVVVGASDTIAASRASNSYQFLIGNLGFAPPFFTTDHITQAADGSQMTMFGSATFSIGADDPKRASGGGRYMINDPSGDLVASGNWSVTLLGGFTDYGNSPPEFPASFHGGKLEAQIDLEGLGEARMTIVCSIGNSPPPKNFEAALVSIGNWHFTAPIQGFTVFIAQ